MPENTVKPALRLALRLHEIGDASPYRLFFAGKGKSGASFGFTQGDLAAGQSVVRDTFRSAMNADGMDLATEEDLRRRLSIPLIANPLSDGETELIDNALAADTGRPLVDEMDESILSGVYGQLDRCLAAARAADRTVAPKAQIYMSLWINMTGAPTALLRWLSGEPVSMAKPLAPAGPVVDGPAMEAYLAATNYCTENPGNLPHMLQCAAAGNAVLSTSGS